MEFAFALPLILIPLAFPIMAGLMALNFGRRFWPWFWISFLLPFISCFILLCLPDKRKKPLPVENEEVFEHLFLN